MVDNTDNTFHKYRVIFPWESKLWSQHKDKLSLPITSIPEMDSKIASMHKRFHPRQLSESLNMFYTDPSIDHVVSKDKFIKDIIPMMQKLILDGPKTFKKFTGRILMPKSNANIVINRLQVATIMSCIWFGLFSSDWLHGGKRRQKKKKEDVDFDPDNLTEDDFQEITLTHGFQAPNKCFTQAVLNYFSRIHEIYSTSPNELTNQIIIYKRHYYDYNIDWKTYDVPLAEVMIGEGALDESDAKIKIAFAHDVPGGESLFGGILSQEELMMLSRPELIPIILFCPLIDEKEVLVGLGAEKMSVFKGFGSSTSFGGDFKDATPIGGKDEKLLQCAVVFMDATQKTTTKSQCIGEFIRDMHKAYVGFSALSMKTAIATGNWIYGFNSGNIYVKYIQQIIAATLANKTLIYYPSGRDVDLEVTSFTEWLMCNKISVKTLLEAYKTVITDNIESDNSRLSDLNIFNEIMDL